MFHLITGGQPVKVSVDAYRESVLPGWRQADGLLHIAFASRRGLLPNVRTAIDFVAETLNPRTICWEPVL
ncbi:MAG TPA: hypothetical protein VH353_10875 [Caulobacteraceae bacterium]|nr:hypothetical protein [Caulobacteraceae bacterium]